MLVLVFLLVLFIFWQFKVLKKYAFTYNKIQLHIPQRYVVIDGQRINFEEIDYVTVHELEQPSSVEKIFSKAATAIYITRMVFHLKAGNCVACVFNHKGLLYKVLKQLQPFVRIEANIESYAVSFFNLGTIIGITAFMVWIYLLTRS